MSVQKLQGKLIIKITHDTDKYREVTDFLKCLHRKGFLMKFHKFIKSGKSYSLKKKKNPQFCKGNSTIFQ